MNRAQHRHAEAVQRIAAKHPIVEVKGVLECHLDVLFTPRQQEQRCGRYHLHCRKYRDGWHLVLHGESACRALHQCARNRIAPCGVSSEC